MTAWGDIIRRSGGDVLNDQGDDREGWCEWVARKGPLAGRTQWRAWIINGAGKFDIQLINGPYFIQDRERAMTDLRRRALFAEYGG